MRSIIVLFLFCLSCSKQDKITVKESPEVKPTSIQTIVKEKLLVEKLTEKEKLAILLGSPPQQPRVKTFQEVTSFLDPYGDTFAYTNFDDTKEKYKKTSVDFLSFLNKNSSKNETGKNIFETFANVITTLGLWDFDAIGLSHFRLNETLVRNKFCMHLKSSSSPKFFWHSFGMPDSFDILGILPEETLFSTGVKIDIERVLEMNAFLKTSQGKEKQTLTPALQILTKLTPHFDGQVGLAIFEGSEKPLINEFKLPNLTACLYLKTKSNFQKENFERSALNKDLMTLAISFGLRLRTRFQDGYYLLFLDETAYNIFNNSQISLLKSEHIKSMKEHLPKAFNNYSYLSPKVTKKAYSLLKQQAATLMDEYTFEQIFPENLLSYHFLNVMESKDNGLYMTGLSNGDSPAFLISELVTLSLNILLFFPDLDYKDTFKESTALLTPLASKFKKEESVAKEFEQTLSTKGTRADLNILWDALHKYGERNAGKYPRLHDRGGIEQLIEHRLIKKASYLVSDMDTKRTPSKDGYLQENEISYLYLGAEVFGTYNGSYFPLILTKPKVLGAGFMVLFANGKIQYFKKGGSGVSKMLGEINKQYAFNDRQKEILRFKYMDFKEYW
jgi:hypothetical protein